MHSTTRKKQASMHVESIESHRVGSARGPFPSSSSSARRSASRTHSMSCIGALQMGPPTRKPLPVSAHLGGHVGPVGAEKWPLPAPRWGAWKRPAGWRWKEPQPRDWYTRLVLSDAFFTSAGEV